MRNKKCLRGLTLVLNIRLFFLFLSNVEKKISQRCQNWEIVLKKSQETAFYRKKKRDKENNNKKSFTDFDCTVLYEDRT